MSDDDAEVIDFATERAKLTELDLRREPPALGARTCWHPRVIVWDDQYKVTCADCNVPLEPHRVLRQFAHQERTFRFKESEARAELERLGKRIDELKREERNLRARVKRLHDRF